MRKRIPSRVLVHSTDERFVEIHKQLKKYESHSENTVRTYTCLMMFGQIKKIYPYDIQSHRELDKQYPGGYVKVKTFTKEEYNAIKNSIK